MSPCGVLALQRIVRGHAAAEGRVRHARRCQKARPVRHPPPAARPPESRMRGGGRSTSLRRFSTAFLSPPRQGLTCRPALAGGWVAGALFVVSGRLFGAIEFRRRDRSGHSGGRSRAAASTSTKPTLGRPPTHASAGAGRRTGPRRPRGDQPKSQPVPFCDCSTPLPEPEVSISRLRRSPATVRCTAPTVYPPLVEGASISTHPDRRCRRTRARTQRHRADTRVRLIVHPPIEALPPIRVPAGDDPLLGEELRQSLGLSDEEFDGLRPYVPGDDLRKIHWPSSLGATNSRFGSSVPGGTAASRS